MTSLENIAIVLAVIAGLLAGLFIIILFISFTLCDIEKAIKGRK